MRAAASRGSRGKTPSTRRSAFLRKNGDEHAVVALNFTPVPRQGYRVGVPRPGRYREILSSDSRYYGGSDLGNGIVADRSPRRAWISRARSS